MTQSPSMSGSTESFENAPILYSPRIMENGKKCVSREYVFSKSMPFLEKASATWANISAGVVFVVCLLLFP